ncbi:MAG: permease [Desulfuromusa sp.]
MNSQTEPGGSTDLSANLQKTGKMLLRVFPNILAVVLLSGLIMEFVPMNRLSEFLGGGFFTDGLVGAGIGSISIGNPLVSYVLGGELLDQGVSLVAVTALLVSWVTVGSIQLPAEIQTFGARFALLRNGLSFLFALIIAFLVLMSMQLLTGWFQ